MAQLKLDEEISIKSVKIFGFNSPHEMLVSLVKQKGKCYVSVSRIRKSKDLNGAEKITHRNSIWIPLDFAKEIAQIIYTAAQEGEKLGWHDIDDGTSQTYLLDLLDEEEERFEEKFVVRRDARILLTASANFLAETFSLSVNVKAVVEKIKLSGIRVIRAIEYLEDLGFIKQIESVDNAHINSLTKLLEQPAMPVMNLNTAKILNDKIIERAIQMTNFTEKDVDGLDFLDDDDPKIEIWNCAKNIAKIEIANVFVNSQIPITFKITAAGYDWLAKKNDEDIF